MVQRLTLDARRAERGGRGPKRPHFSLLGWLTREVMRRARSSVEARRCGAEGCVGGGGHEQRHFWALCCGCEVKSWSSLAPRTRRCRKGIVRQWIWNLRLSGEAWGFGREGVSIDNSVSGRVWSGAQIGSADRNALLHCVCVEGVISLRATSNLGLNRAVRSVDGERHRMFLDSVPGFSEIWTCF